MAGNIAKQTAISSEDSWRAESDHSTLQRACEIMADRIRMRAVMQYHEKTSRAQKKMASMLSGYRRSGSIKG